MNKETLRYIKNDMWQTLYNKKDLQAVLKRKLKQVEAERKEALAENEGYGYDENSLAWFNERTNRIYNQRRIAVIENEYSQWHNDKSYYLIYKDGSCVCISAEEILGGEKFPKMSDIVYAMLQSADEIIDTEGGDVDWYSDAHMEACDWNYKVEDNRKWQYETAIEFKFGTEWAIKYRQNNPGFIPVEI